MKLGVRRSKLTRRTAIAAGTVFVILPLTAACGEPPGPSGGATGTAGEPPVPFFVEYSLPGEINGPLGITAGPPGDDHVWFTAGEADHNIGHASATDVPSSLFSVEGVATGLAQIAAAPDGNLWVTVVTIPGLGGNAVYCISFTPKPDQPGKLNVESCGAYVIPPDDVLEPLLPKGSRGLWGLTAGPDGNLYFTQLYADRIGCFTPTNPPESCGEWVVGGGPTEIVTGPDGNLYFTENDANKIGAFDPKNQKLIGEWAIPTANSGPSAITVGPDGDLWFTEKVASKIGRFSIATKTVYGEWPLPTNSKPSGITAGPPGDTFVWFTETDTNMIGRINTADLKPPEHFLIPTPACSPFGITVGPDRHIWFTESTGNKIGRTFLTATEYPPKELGS